MIELKYDVNKAPLGRLTEAQIRSGYAALSKIVATRKRRDQTGAEIRPTLLQDNNDYYTRVPHVSGMRKPPTIENAKDIRRELELQESLADIEVVVNLKKNFDELQDLHPIDQKIDQK